MLDRLNDLAKQNMFVKLQSYDLCGREKDKALDVGESYEERH